VSDTAKYAESPAKLTHMWT